MALIFRTSDTANAGTSYIKNTPLTYSEGDGNLAWLATNMSGSVVTITSTSNLNIYPNNTVNLIADDAILTNIARTAGAAQYQTWYTSGASVRRGYFGFPGLSSNTLGLTNETNGTVQVIAGTLGVSLANGGTSWTSLSDERLKTDLMPIQNATQKVNSLRAVTGRFKTDDEGKSRAFLIAQEVELVLPEAIDINDDEIQSLGVRYTDVIPLLVAAIKELKAEIDLLKAQK